MPFPLKVRILGGPIMSTQRIKIDLEGDYAFGDLYYYIRRQLPKILSEDQAAQTLAVTPENYDLVFVDVQEGRAKALETCMLSQKIKDAQWVCPALMLRVRDGAIRSVIRSQSEKNMLGGSSSSNFGGGGGAMKGGAPTRASGGGGGGVSFDVEPSQRISTPTSKRLLEPEEAKRTLQRLQSTYMWSDQVERTAASNIQQPDGGSYIEDTLSSSGRLNLGLPQQRAATGSLPTTPHPTSRGSSRSSPTGSIQPDFVPPAVSGRDDGMGIAYFDTGSGTFASQQQQQQRQRLTSNDSQRGASFASPPYVTSIGSPSVASSSASPMRSAWRKLSNVVTAASPVQLKEFSLNLSNRGDDDDGAGAGGDEVRPLLRRKSSLTAQLMDLPATTLPTGPTYAHEEQAMSYRERLMALLAVYDPKALRKIDRILTKSKGKEEQLLQLAVLKYGPEPRYSNVARGGAFTMLQQNDLSGAWTDPSLARRASIGEEVLRRATNTHANSVISINDDGIISYKGEFRDMVEYLFEVYDFLTPTAVSLFLQRVQASPKALATNLTLHMQLYKQLRLNVEREDQLERRQVERQLFLEQHAAHQHTRALMWFDISCSIERRRFEGVHLILRSSIPPQYFLGWLYLQRQETYAWESVLRDDLIRKQLTWFHIFQRAFYVEKETVQRRAILVAHRAESHHLQRFCYCDRETVRRTAREVEEYRQRCVLEQWKIIDLERHFRNVHSVEVLESLDRRCEEFSYTSTAFNVPIRAMRFFEAQFRELYELNEIENRMRTVHCISQRRAWIFLEQKYVLATETERREELIRIRNDFIEKRKEQFEFGLVEADKRTLTIHFEMGCRWRILQRRWMGRELVVRNEHMRQWLRERSELESQAMLSREDASRRTLKRYEGTTKFNVLMKKLQDDEEPEGRWFHIFGESATFRHYQRQYMYFLESTARHDVRFYALTRQFWMLEAKRRGDIEIQEQENIIAISSGGGGSMEAVRRQSIVNDGLKHLFELFQREVITREETLRSRIYPAEHDARLRIFRKGIYEGEDSTRRGLVRAQEWTERETLVRWNLYQQEFQRRTLVLYYHHNLQLHFITAKAYVRYREQRQRFCDIKEPLDRGLETLQEQSEWDELELAAVVSEEDARRKELYRREKAELRLPLYREEKKDRDTVERNEIFGEERERRIYWKIFELFTFERIPRLEITYGLERRWRHHHERNFLLGLESKYRNQIDRVDYMRGLFVLEQRKLMDRERIARRFTLEPFIMKGLQGIERKMLEGVEDISRLIVFDRWNSMNHIFEQKSLQLFYFVVRSHVRQDEFLARKYIERERLVDQEESSRRKLRNGALASLQKWWQKTNLQGRQDVIVYANKLQREDDNRLARDNAQKRIEERLAARVAEKQKASEDAKRNQVMSIVLNEEMHARSAIWESERDRRSEFVHELSEWVHATPQIQPAAVKSKQKALKSISNYSKLIKTAPSLEQFISMLPPMPKSKRSTSKSPGGTVTGGAVTSDDEDTQVDDAPSQRLGADDDVLNDMNSHLDDDDEGEEGDNWVGASESRSSFTRGMSMVLPPIARSNSTVGGGGGDDTTSSGGGGSSLLPSLQSPMQRKSSLRSGGGGGGDTVPSELYAQSPSRRPGINDFRSSGNNNNSLNVSSSRNSTNRGSVTFPTSPAVSVSQVGLQLSSPSTSTRRRRGNNDDEEDEDEYALPPI